MRPDEPARIGRTTLHVSRLGVGTVALGNMYEAVPESAAADVLDEAGKWGLTHFDTAPLYGMGLAERRIGPLLATRPRDSFVLSTKVGRLLRADAPIDPRTLRDGKPLFVDTPPLNPVFDFSYDATLRCVEESLERLGLDRVDILYLHDPDDHYEQALNGAYRALERLRGEGAVTAIGAGMTQTRMLAQFARAGDFDCFLLAGRYTLLDQSALTELLPLCQARGISLVIGGVYNSGILTNPVPGARYDYRGAPPELVSRAQRIAAICARHDVPLKAAAIQFPFGHPAVASVLTGVRSSAELAENAAMLSLPIPPQMWEELRAEDLLSQEVPVPAV